MERPQSRPGWAVPSRPDSRASMKAKAKQKANTQHRYSSHHQHARSVSSESHWLRFGTLEDAEIEKAVVAPRNKPPRFTRSGGCLRIFDVVGWKLRRGFWRSMRRRTSQDAGKGEKDRS